MTEYTPDQVKFIENFTNKRDSLTLEVGLLTHEKEELLATNQDLSETNASLQRGIDEMNANASTIAFEQAEKVNQLRAEKNILEEEIKALTAKRMLLVEDLDSKNNTLVTLGVVIKSIQVATEDTTQKIKGMGNELTKYTSQVGTAAELISAEANRVQSFTNELATVIDTERKTNYERTREIDAREIGVIGREKLAEMKYNEVVKKLNETK